MRVELPSSRRWSAMYRDVDESDPDSVEAAMPGHTCHDINAMLSDIKEGSRAAARAARSTEDKDAASALTDAESAFDALPNDLESLRKCNAALRELCEAALSGWRKANEKLERIKEIADP